ncbi:MAG: DNA recombination protein RmuC [Rhodospirillales bacterium]|nr:DNA recombination protein RmuC [Rhodospirillales bacterium]
MDPNILNQLTDPMLLLAIIAGLAGLGIGAVVAVALARRDRSASAEISGRLSQMAESQAAVQARLGEQLQAQERAVTKALEERLTELSKRVGDRLQDSATRSHNTLAELRERLAVIDRAQKNITELSTQVVGLQEILNNKQARGSFGEIQLKDLVENILPPSAYAFQATLGNGKRADCLLKLPNPPGPIAIDSKFPLEGYEALRNAGDDAARLQARRRLAADLRTHVQAIAGRYILPGETAESALMFLPSEAVYAELHANFREVVEESYRARVWIVSPTTLMATLNTVRAVLKDVQMRKQAGVIQAEVTKLLEDIARLDERTGKLQRHFDQAADDLRLIRVSTEKITRRGLRIEELEFEEPETAEPAIAPSRPRAVGD